MENTGIGELFDCVGRIFFKKEGTDEKKKKKEKEKAKKEEEEETNKEFKLKPFHK